MYEPPYPEDSQYRKNALIRHKENKRKAQKYEIKNNYEKTINFFF